MKGRTLRPAYFTGIINLPQLLRVLGALLMIEAAFMLLPLGVSLLRGESDTRAFAIAAAAALAVGAPMHYCPRPRSSNLGRRDGCLLTVAAWLLFALFGMVPFMLCATPLNAAEAFFETVSGFTTTGATVYQDIERVSHGVVFWRALTQWLGGMGIIVFTLAVFPSLNTGGGVSMFRAESSGITLNKLGSRIADTAKVLWGVYAVLTLLLVALLWAGPMGLFESVCHAMATISTGGFSTRNESIAAFASPYVKVVLTVFMFIGGVNFALIIMAVKRRSLKALRNDVLAAYLRFIAVYYVLFAGAIVAGGHLRGWESVTIDPLFHIVSAMTSTGLGAGDFEAWGAMALALTMVMMYVGACAGSTTGGAKIDRVLFMLKNFRSELRRNISPSTLRPVGINGKAVSYGTASEIMAFLMIYTLMIIAGGIVLAAAGFPLVDAFFSSFSCMANSGLGAGITGVTGSFHFLPDFSKWVMSFLMLAGRLEVFSLIVLFCPAFWRR